MPLSDTATVHPWDSFRSEGGASLVREAVELVPQELIEVEAAEAIGAGRYERSEARVTERNGRRPRPLVTRAGDVELKTSKLRKGILFSSMLLGGPMIRPGRKGPNAPCLHSGSRSAETS